MKNLEFPGFFAFANENSWKKLGRKNMHITSMGKENPYFKPFFLGFGLRPPRKIAPGRQFSIPETTERPEE
ncbi:hypothetical protein [Hyphococcus sp.]|uniref:hypothetical protein n=1 Tax=Hyphococcus sp. TaxID=2038636 RepID=UPI0035C69B8D